ncbi:MAG: hypothetical protein HZB67_01815 [Candidatus Aenigmarchaeota archaeon]|nr:hypothetical protein [Candidatus Aenigmarchaeota archaeon]
MEIKTKLFFLAIVAMVVAVSGCVGQKPVVTASNDGIVITDFSADSYAVDEGELVTFSIDVENQGGVDASYVMAELSGVENNWRESDGSIVVDTMPKWGDLDMKAPDPQYNMPGGYKTTYWKLKTPEVPQLTMSFPVKAKVTYMYKTTGAIQVKSFGSTYYETEYLAKGKTLTDAMTVTNTNAPVKILLTDKTPPIIVDDSMDADEMQSFVIRFKLQNVGSGFPVTEGVPGRFYGNINIAGGPFKFKDCLGVIDSSEVEINEDNVDLAKLKLRSGEVTISCEVEVSKSAWASRQEETMNMLFDLYYGYYVDKEVSVKIFGK